MRDLDRIANRPRLYHNIDGVGELSIAVMCLGFGLLEWLQLHTAPNSIWNRMYTLFVFVGVMCVGLHFGTKAIKSRITWPRTGYVEYRKRDTIWLPLIIGCTTAMLGSIAFFVLKAPAAIIGLVFAGAYAHKIAQVEPWKWAIVGAILAGTLLLATSNLSLRDNLWMSITGYGALLLVSGTITLRQYLRHNPGRAE